MVPAATQEKILKIICAVHSRTVRAPSVAHSRNVPFGRRIHRQVLALQTRKPLYCLTIDTQMNEGETKRWQSQ